MCFVVNLILELIFDGYNLTIESLLIMQKDRQAKQRYLRQNILDKEYDAQEFMDFCQNYKGSVDIDSWTLQELKDIVQKFISSNSKTLQLSPFEYSAASKPQSSPALQNFDWDSAFKPIQKEESAVNLNLVDLDFLQMMGVGTSPPIVKKQPEQKPPQNQIITDPSAILAKLNDKNNEFISAFNANAIHKKPSEKGSGKEISLVKQEQLIEKAVNSDNNSVNNNTVFTPNVKESVIIQQNFKASVKCKTFMNKAKLDGDYEVIINGHQIINPNPFIPNYVLYSITTNPINREVKRRLKDFQTLRNILKKVFPSTQIPFLQRCGRLSETEPTVIKKQKLFLQSFLNSLLMNKSLRCKIIDDFLLCENLDSLKKNFRDFQKIQKPKSIEQLYNPTGKLELQYNAANRKFISQQQLYLEYLQPNFMKLKELYDQLLLSFANSVRIMTDISDLYDSIRASTRNVNSLLLEQHKSPFLQESLERISDLHKHWSLSLKTQTKLMQVEIRHLYRYQFDNLQTIKEVCKQCSSLVQAYSKRSDKDQASKQQYEYNKKLNDYKVGVDSASKNTTVLKYQAGYYLNATVVEIKRYFEELSLKLLKKFKIFSVLQMNINNDLDHHWKQFQKFANQT